MMKGFEEFMNKNLKILAMMVILSFSGILMSDTQFHSLEKQLENKFKEHFSTKMELSPEDFDLRVENIVLYPNIEESLNSMRLIELMGFGALGSQRMDGLFTLSATFQSSAGKITEHQISGLIHVSGPVWVSANNLNRGKIIVETDLALVKMPWKTLASGIAMTSRKDMLGHSVTRFVNRGSPMSMESLEPASSVKVGDLVELTVQSGPGVLIRSRAIARQKGRIGEFIRVEQEDTRKSLQVVVTGDKQVGVQL